jgi:hypothetical protein
MTGRTPEPALSHRTIVCAAQSLHRSGAGTARRRCRRAGCWRPPWALTVRCCCGLATLAPTPSPTTSPCCTRPSVNSRQRRRAPAPKMAGRRGPRSGCPGGFPSGQPGPGDRRSPASRCCCDAGIVRWMWVP